MALKDIQQQFLGQVLGKKDCDISGLIEEHGAINKQQRIDIYSHAYRIRLKQCIESDHPVLGIYLGDELFDLMVEKYIDAYPSQNTSLRFFAEQLATLLKTVVPFNSHRIIAELATFERSLLFAFDAPDLKTSTTDDLANIPIERWPELQFDLHPSVRILNTDYNVIEIWQAIKAKKQDVPQPIEKKACCLIWRNPERLTEFKSISPFELQIINDMLNKKNFSDICLMLAEFYHEDEIQQVILNHLVGLLQTNIIKLNY